MLYPPKDPNFLAESPWNGFCADCSGQHVGRPLEKAKRQSSRIAIWVRMTRSNHSFFQPRSQWTSASGRTAENVGTDCVTSTRSQRGGTMMVAGIRPPWIFRTIQAVACGIISDRCYIGNRRRFLWESTNDSRRADLQFGVGPA